MPQTRRIYQSMKIRFCDSLSFQLICSILSPRVSCLKGHHPDIYPLYLLRTVDLATLLSPLRVRSPPT